MNAGNYALVEILFTGVTVLGLAFWQLWSVNREIRKDKAAKAQQAPLPEGEGTPARHGGRSVERSPRA